MKIAHLMIGNGWGGVQSFFRDCCIELADRGRAVLAVDTNETGLSEVMSSHSAPFKLAEVSNRFGSYDWSTVRQFRRILKQFDPDIVFSHGQRASLFADQVEPENHANDLWPFW